MKMNILRFLTISITIISFLFINCTRHVMAGGEGNGSETVALRGQLVDTLGRPAFLAQVVLVPVAYNPIVDGALPQTQTATTDLQGNYALTVPDSGMYNIQAAQSQDLASLLIRNIRVASDSVLVPTDTLRSPGTIKVVVPNGLDVGNGYFYIPGTTIFSWLSDNNGFVNLHSVPARVNLSLYYGVKSGPAQPQLVRDSIAVASGGITTIANVGWRFSKKLVLNTTASGAGVAGTVTNFPVLVRLTGTNFAFENAAPGGADIRFTKFDGTPVNYEIEQWDSIGRQATVWVKIDTVFGNDNSHYINMYWGASNATSASNSAAVFDTTDGFQGVWHMAASKTQALDATANRFNGTLSDTAPSATTGIIGACQQFNGTSNYIRMSGTASGKLDFPEHGTYALSAWVYVDTLDTMYARIICKNNFQYKLQIDYFKTWSFAEFEGGTGYELTNSPASAKAWVYLVGVRSGASQYLYVNGALVNSALAAQPYIAARDTTSDVTIGRSAKTPPGDPCFFKGKIDEARIENRANGSDWIKLCYMNQKAVDALVIFK